MSQGGPGGKPGQQASAGDFCLAGRWRRGGRRCRHLSTCPSKKEEATGVSGARWVLCPCGTHIADGGERCSRVDLGCTWARNTTGDGSDNSTMHAIDHCNAKDKWRRGRAPRPSDSAGCRGRPGVIRTARGASTAEETRLLHIISCFQHVSICNLDVS